MCSSIFVNVTTRFNYFPGNSSGKKSSRDIFLVTGDPGKTESPNIVSISIGEMEHVSVLLCPHLSSTFICGIQQLYHPLPLLPLLLDSEETAAVLVLSVVEMATEVAESVAVSDVVEVVTETVEAVVEAHKFEMVMMPLLVCFTIEELQLEQQP